MVLPTVAIFSRVRKIIILDLPEGLSEGRSMARHKPLTDSVLYLLESIATIGCLWRDQQVVRLGQVQLTTMSSC